MLDSKHDRDRGALRWLEASGPERCIRYARGAALLGTELVAIEAWGGLMGGIVREAWFISVLADGHGEVAGGGDARGWSRGELHIGAPGTPMRMSRRGSARVRTHTLFVPPYVVGRAGEVGESGFHDVRHDRPLASAIEMLVRATLRPEGALTIESLTLEVIGHLRRLVTGVGARPARRHPGIARARERIHDEIGDDLRLDYLARTAGLSREHFVRAFAKELGLPPHEYLMRLRVDVARRLLAEGRRPIEVAFEAGFCDQSHLNRWFRRIVGTTPSAYAQAHAGG